MADLWKAIGELAASVHPDRMTSVAEAISKLKGIDEFDRARHAFGPNVDQGRMDRLRACWETSPATSPAEVAAAFRGAAAVAALNDGRGTIELVWTGPKTGLIPTRRTEQVILEVIDSAQNDVFLVTYVFYRASSIVTALNAAIGRGVNVSILLESSTGHGGVVRGDSVKALSTAVSGAHIYVWDPDSKAPKGGSLSAAVHAKCAVADHRLAFITSANLTSAALERNMELGLLIKGGTVPDRLKSHLSALVTSKVIKKWESPDDTKPVS